MAKPLAPRAPHRAGSRRRGVLPLALALLLLTVIVNLVGLGELKQFVTSAPRVRAKRATVDDDAACETSDNPHRDPLFVKQAKCVTKREVVHVLRDLVISAAQLFERHNVTYFLDSGTLLGAFRDRRVIVYDTDADMAVDLAGFDYIRQHKIEVPDEYFLSVYASGDLYPGSQRDKGIPIRLVHKLTALYVDVFVFSAREDEASPRGDAMVGPEPSWALDRCVHCPEYYNQGKQLLVPHAWVYPTVDCEFEGVALQCPHESEKYLRHMFGDDFRTPIQY